MARTGAERYFQDRRKTPEYERAYEAARQRIDQIDGIMNEKCCASCLFSYTGPDHQRSAKPAAEHWRFWFGVPEEGWLNIYCRRYPTTVKNRADHWCGEWFAGKAPDD